MTKEYSHYDDEYYVLLAENNPNYPMTDIDEERYSDWRDTGVFANPFELYNDGYVYPIAPCDPIPENPEFVDYHDEPALFSLRVIEEVTQMAIKGTQWFPACIHYKEARYDDYIIMHTYQEIKCLDLGRSDFENSTPRRLNIKSIVLNKEVLDSIPIEDRLIFRLAESTSKHYFHKSIVDEIMKHNPKGCRFIKSKDWGVGTAFD